MSPGQRATNRRGFNAYLTEEDMERLERLAARFPTAEGRPNKTAAVQAALEALEQAIEQHTKDV